MARRHVVMVLVAIVCGLGAGLSAVAFRQLIKTIQELFFGAGPSLLESARGVSWTWRLAAPTLGGLLVGPLVYIVAREARGHGVPEVMEALLTRGGAIRPRVVIVKALASALTIGSGGSVGREGPIVQIGAALGSTIGQLLGFSREQLRTLVGCGAAAGIAAAFNAPIAGALFAVEILLGDFAVPQFSPIVISSVVATVVSRHFLGDFPAFQVPHYQLVSPFELLPYAVLGVISGVVALGFIRVLYRSEEVFEHLPVPDLLKSPLGGFIVGAIGISLPEVFGVGYTTINAALTSELSLGLLATLLLAKMMATSVTLASGGSGGVFAPSLFLGAMTGGLFGTTVHAMFPAMTAASGAYALVGMGAVVGAATHAPITAIIIIFEMTGDYRIIPPLMTACVISSLVAVWLSPDSIYTLKLTLRGLDPFRREEANVLKSLRVEEVIDREPEVIAAATPVAEVLEHVVSSRRSEFFVVDADGSLVGSLSLSRLRELLFGDAQPAAADEISALADPDVPRVTEDDDLDLVMNLFSDRENDELAVVVADDHDRLVGSVNRRSVIQARARELLRQDLSAGVSSALRLAGRVREVEIVPGLSLREMPVPASLIGLSLREMDLRAVHGVQIVLVKRLVVDASKDDFTVPDRDAVFRSGDRLLVIGSPTALDALSAI